MLNVPSYTAPLRVMLVEDDEVDVMNVKRSFKKMGLKHELILASDGVDALEKLRGYTSNFPQVILLDINMPRMSGLEFLKTLREDNSLKSATVFVMTTSDNPKDKLSAFGLNVAGYIVKPISSERFHHALERLVSLWGICEFP
jgi:CheY-like chemotaxis protein